MARRTLEVIVAGDARGFRGAVGEAESGMGRIRSTALGVGGALAGAFAIREIGQFGAELIGIAGQLDVWDTKVSTVFEGSADSVRAWADDNNEALGLTDDNLAALAANFGDLVKPMGFTAAEAGDMAQDVLGLSGALSAWSGGTRSAADVSQILGKAMLGEREQLKELGIAINQAEVNERALAVARADGRDEITAMDKAIATQQLIMEKSTDAQEAWADGSMDNVKNANELKAKFAELKETLAEKLLPVFVRVTEWLVSDFIPAMEAVAAWVAVNWPGIRDVIVDVMTRIRDIIEDVWAVIQAVWERVGDDILGYVERIWPAIKQIVEGVMQVIRGLVDFWMGLLSGDWGRAWDGIKTYVEGIWNLIAGGVRAFIAVIRFYLGLFVEFFGELPGKILGAIAALPGMLFNFGIDMMLKLLQGVGEMVNGAFGVLAWMRGIPGMIVGALSAAGTALKSIGRAIIQGLWDGLKDKWTAVARWFGNRIDDVKGFFTSGFGILSPSKVFKNYGEMIGKGFEIGLKKGWPDTAISSISATPKFAGVGGGTGATITLVGDTFTGTQVVQLLQEVERSTGSVPIRVNKAVRVA